MSKRTRSLQIGRAENSPIDWALNISDEIYEARISAGASANVTVPTGVNTVYFSYSAAVNLKVDVNVIPTATGAGFSATTAIRNPIGRLFTQAIKPGDVIHVFNDGTDPADVTIEFFKGAQPPA